MMFPTPVGMNRRARPDGNSRFHVPHTRGDEPDYGMYVSGNFLCSPHPWG